MAPATTSILFALYLTAATSLLAQERPPQRMLHYLKPGNYLALGSIGATENFAVTLLTSEQFTHLADARKLSFAKMLERYPVLRLDVDRQTVELAKGIAERRQRGEEVDENWEQKLTFEKGEYQTLCRIEHVGEDYVLLEVADAGNEPSKMAIATTTIKRVMWRGPLKVRYNPPLFIEAR